MAKSECLLFSYSVPKFFSASDVMYPMLNVDTIKTNNNYIDNNPILDIKLEDDMDDLSTYETVYKFLLTGSLTSGQLDANGLLLVPVPLLGTPPSAPPLHLLH